jgi:hypothetical protein
MGGDVLMSVTEALTRLKAEAPGAKDHNSPRSIRQATPTSSSR